MSNRSHLQRLAITPILSGSMHFAAVMGELAGINLRSPRRAPAGGKPEKPCLHCGSPHTTGKPFCSATCCQKERAGEPRPQPPTVVAVDPGSDMGTVVVLMEFPDAPASQPPETQ